jgi:single-strand DNA-binding protein
MSDTITLRGLVATTPRQITTESGLEVTSFRLASTTRKLDTETGVWVDSDVNWFTISSFRQLAANVAQSISKGERIVVSGRLKVRDWDNGERSGTSVEIEAAAIGHDLTFGTSAFERRSLVVADPEDEEEVELESELQTA